MGIFTDGEQQNTEYLKLKYSPSTPDSHETVFWPGKNTDLQNCIVHCGVCTTYQKDQQKEPLICHKIPNCPWETVGGDIFYLENRDYLFTLDYYSSYNVL